MTLRRKLILPAVAIAGALAISGYSLPASAQYGGGWMGPGMMYGYGDAGGGYGPGWMGSGMMYGGGYGPGSWMMGQGWMGPGMMYGYGPGGGAWGPPQQANLNLTIDQVKSNMERWLQSNGNARVKLGNVAQKDTDTITADIVTKDKDALVQRFEVNRHTGFVQPAGD